jgi:hypothetical protein
VHEDTLLIPALKVPLGHGSACMFCTTAQWQHSQPQQAWNQSVIGSIPLWGFQGSMLDKHHGMMRTTVSAMPPCACMAGLDAVFLLTGLAAHLLTNTQHAAGRAWERSRAPTFAQHALQACSPGKRSQEAPCRQLQILRVATRLSDQKGRVCRTAGCFRSCRSPLCMQMLCRQVCIHSQAE